jgi:hypothetical protein
VLERCNNDVDDDCSASHFAFVRRVLQDPLAADGFGVALSGLPGVSSFWTGGVGAL